MENSQKIKLLKILELLQRETDEQHPISRLDLCRRMEEQGISCSPRTLTRDMAVFHEYGYEIMSCQLGHQRGYYVIDRSFSVPELKILMDAVQAAGFITEKKTTELIEKIADLGGSNRAALLKDNLVRFNTRKHSNESVYYNVSYLEEALRKKHKASFCYFDLDENAQRVYRREHERYITEPLALVFDAGYYYLLCYNTDPEKFGDTVTYRVDRMDAVNVEEESVSSEAKAQRKGLDGYTSRVFRMFGGPEEKSRLTFTNDLIGVVFDYFGEDIQINRNDEETCSVIVLVQLSPTFWGWVHQFGEKMNVELLTGGHENA